METICVFISKVLPKKVVSSVIWDKLHLIIRRSTLNVLQKYEPQSKPKFKAYL